MLEALESLQRHEQLGSLTRLIRALAPSWYAQLMPPTDNDSSAARLAAETAGGSQERLKREIASLLEEAGRLQPIVLWFDDVHWADPSTTDLLGYLARRLDNTRLLVIATARPSELRQSRHPFLALKLDLLAHGFCREIAPVVPERSRDRALHRAPVSGARLPVRFRRPDSRSHRRQRALHGRRAARHATAPGHPAAGREMDHRRRPAGHRPRAARVGTRA